MDKLKEKLTLAWDMAARHDEEAKAKSKSYFDRRATTRAFEVGDMVMTLEPSPTDKFQPQWNGPYKIVEKVTIKFSCRIDARKRNFSRSMD